MKLKRLWNRGVGGALLAMLIVGAVLAVVATLLSGCTGTRVLTEYEHKSSAPDFYDRNTSDEVGFSIEMPLGSGCGDYCPELSGGLHWEVTDHQVFGDSPTGTIRVRQPIWVKR